MLATGFIPDDCKQRAVVVPIPKEGKDQSLPSGYRPISLLPVIPKLLETIMTARLLAHLESRRLLATNQSGFRRGKSTADQLFRLAQDAAEGLLIDDTMVLVLLDVAAAFDTVWHNGLLYKLHRAGLPRALVRWLAAFLRNRRFNVRVDGVCSSDHSINAGVPQGSSLSPVLFVFFVADLLTDYPRPFRDGQYADDVELENRSQGPQLAQSLVQKGLDQVTAWYRRWRMKLNAKKSAALGISRRRKAFKPKLFIEKEEIPTPDTVTYLGVEFSPKLSWKPHIEKVIKKASKRLNGLKIVCRKKFGLKPQYAVNVYKAFIRPVLDYGVQAWIGLPDYLLVRLQRIENAALRIAYRLPRWTRVQDLHRIANVEPLGIWLHERCVNFAKLALATNPPIGRAIWHSRNQSRPRKAPKRIRTPLSMFESSVTAGPRV